MTGTAKVGAVVAIASASSVAAVFVPAAPWTADLFDWLRHAGAFGVVVYALVFAIAAVCLVPGSILTVGAGVAYGLVWGTVVASTASAAAATAAFLVARTIARRRVARWATSDPRFAALDAAIGDHGLKLVILVRLSPLIPFNVLNYALGLTRVRLRDYALGSFLGMLPVTVLYVYLGSLAGQLASLARGTAQGGPLRHAVSVLGLAATIAATVYVTRLARQALDSALRRS
ncbi:MAG: TVP38/TMEM64 family protein [Vicinamibacteraceae bacterium]